ncbi:hypothetical protein O159_24540 [Leifsonia xyli subsp. cynodontis DSM 46306]|uniref:Camelysin metallo-endopeptidase n=1 Tax=Leifsonia xyli subsp. cynodontis DSM 46306 TaxID=1389489 RepID=U3PFI9_LEIXC|nr:hypothetical protein [Leifsonia xyli]AGW42398.1 hypothetical protein O159_24540 [Leifsonia xyli subsp. cynodontis DSM 46306]
MKAFKTRRDGRLLQKKVRLSRRARIFRAAAVVAALAVSGFSVSQASYSAFSSSVSNTGNSWKTASLSLTSNVTTPLFTPTNIVPGQSASNTITITNGAGITGGVKAYATNASDLSSIAQYFTVTIVEGSLTGGTFTPDQNGTVYNDSLGKFLTQDTSYSTGVGNWKPTSATTKTYQITWTFSASAPNPVQGKTLSADLTWEIQPSAAS